MQVHVVYTYAHTSTQNRPNRDTFTSDHLGRIRHRQIFRCVPLCASTLPLVATLYFLLMSVCASLFSVFFLLLLGSSSQQNCSREISHVPCARACVCLRIRAESVQPFFRTFFSKIRMISAYSTHDHRVLEVIVRNQFTRKLRSHMRQMR